LETVANGNHNIDDETVQDFMVGLSVINWSIYVRCCLAETASATV